MLGFGAIGQFALGQTSAEYVIAAQFVLDDASSPERRRKRKKQQDEAFEEIALGREKLRGAIYDAIHPPEEVTAQPFNPGLLSRQAYPFVFPNDPMVGAVLSANLNEKQRLKILADMQDEDDIAMLLNGGS